jgi:hypothetical protein
MKSGPTISSVLPYPSQDKGENLDYGLMLLKKFCRINHIKEPQVICRDGLGSYGLYDRGEIFIDIKACRPPVKTPGFRWSYTGYKADLTPAGVIAHELGHHVDSRLKKPSRKMSTDGEKKVSSYEPNRSEAFAESMKLFLLNPDLLYEGRPKRYQFLRESCGLSPVIIEEWRVMLFHAHPRLLTAAKGWIKRK